MPVLIRHLKSPCWQGSWAAFSQMGRSRLLLLPGVSSSSRLLSCCQFPVFSFRLVYLSCRCLSPSIFELLLIFISAVLPLQFYLSCTAPLYRFSHLLGNFIRSLGWGLTAGLYQSWTQDHRQLTLWVGVTQMNLSFPPPSLTFLFPLSLKSAKQRSISVLMFREEKNFSFSSALRMSNNQAETCRNSF